MSLLLLLALGILAFSVSGCASAPQRKPGPAAVGLRASELARLLPLKDHTVSTFQGEDEQGQKLWVTLEIERPRDDRAELWIAGKVERLEVSEHEVRRSSGGVLLQGPLRLGANFPGSFGQVTITQVGLELTVPYGTVKDCLETTEQDAGGLRSVKSIYCPELGLTRLETSLQAQAPLRLELVTHGPRVDLRNSGKSATIAE